LAEQAVISCIYYARDDIDKIRGATALAYAAAHEGCFIRCMSPAVEKPHQALDT